MAPLRLAVFFVGIVSTTAFAGPSLRFSRALGAPAQVTPSRLRAACAALVALIALLAGCATPIGQMTEDDFNWSQETVPAGYQEVYRRITEGFRRCDGDGMPAVPIGNLYTDNRTAHIDVYLGSMYGGHTQLPLGMIQIKALSDGTTHVRVAGHKTPESAKLRPGAYRRQQWLDWAAGRPNDQYCRPRAPEYEVDLGGS